MSSNQEAMFEEIGIRLPHILLPAPEIDLQKWAVVACDQFTSEPEYWDRVQRLVGDEPSALNLILPECYLGEPGRPDRINRIHRTMAEYLERGILREHGPALYIIRRHTEGRKPRWGLLAAIDLEQYEYLPGRQSLIRPTEKTVVERIPPRVEVRRNAPIELPHVVTFFDDPAHTVIGPLSERAAHTPPIYSVELMEKGGSLTAYRFDDPALVEMTVQSLHGLGRPEQPAPDSANGSSFLFAVADGNHSLATAKAVWTMIHSTGSVAHDHPARWALVELVNIHDTGVSIEPIHRVLFDFDRKRIDPVVTEKWDISWERVDSLEEAVARSTAVREDAVPSGSAQRTYAFSFVEPGGAGVMTCREEGSLLEVVVLQRILDACLEQDKQSRLDYIHGRESLVRLGSTDNSIGFLLPALDRKAIFSTLMTGEVLPAKSFSLGEPWEKRYYVEARRITNT